MCALLGVGGKDTDSLSQPGPMGSSACKDQGRGLPTALRSGDPTELSQGSPRICLSHWLGKVKP